MSEREWLEGGSEREHLEGSAQAPGVEALVERVRAYILAGPGDRPARKEVLTNLDALRGASVDLRRAFNVESRVLRERVEQLRIEGDHAMDDYEDAETIIRQIAEGRPNTIFDPWARDLCVAFIERPAPDRSVRPTREQLERERDEGFWKQHAEMCERVNREMEAEQERLREAERQALVAHGYEKQRANNCELENVRLREARDEYAAKVATDAFARWQAGRLPFAEYVRRAVASPDAAT